MVEKSQLGEIAIRGMKVYHENKLQVMQPFLGGTDIEESMKIMAEAAETGQNPHTIFIVAS
jgi:hypothetical protein